MTQGRSLAWPLGAALAAVALLVLLAFQSAVTAATFSAGAAFVTALSFVALSRGATGDGCGLRRVGADAHGLSIDGELVVPRRAILRTHVNDELPCGFAVVVETRGFLPSRIVRVESARIAQALADTLEQPLSEVAVFDALPPWSHRLRWPTLLLGASPWLVFNLLRYSPAWTFLLACGLYGMVALPLVLPRKVAIGDDGILIRWAGSSRFVPFALMRGARPTPLGVELGLRNEPDIEIRLTHRTDGRAAERSSLLARIETGLANHRALDHVEDEALLARGERELDVWVRDMTALGTTEAHDYRTRALPRERLWATVESSAANTSARQGAALALRPHLDEDERERLLGAARKTALPRLRLAFDAIARAAEMPRLHAMLDEPDVDDGRERSPSLHVLG